MKTSIIDSFGSFLLLSNLKLMSASFDLLIPTYVYQLNSSSSYTSNVELRLYYDASIVYNGPSHRPYFILAVGVILFLFIPVIIFLLSSSIRF